MSCSIIVASFLYAIAILYGINDLTAVVGSNGSFPLAVVYSQATGNKGATFGLLLIVFLSIMICVLGTFLTVRLSPPHSLATDPPNLTYPGRTDLVGPSP